MKKSLRRRPSAAGASVLITLLFSPVTWAEQVDVAEELERLAADHGFTVKGMEQVEESRGRVEGDELYPRLRRLLQGFDHVIVQAPEGGVEKVIIIGAKVPYEPPPPPPPGDDQPEESADGEVGDAPDAAAPGDQAESGDIILESVRRGTQHAVKTGLEGAGGTRMEQMLLVDTGADNLVLPASMLTKLGLPPNELNQREMQTANGKMTARVGKLPALWLGEARIPNVDVAFVEDGKLGGGGLLGMSVLGRYKMTIDDEANRITLSPK